MCWWNSNFDSSLERTNGIVVGTCTVADVATLLGNNRLITFTMCNIDRKSLGKKCWIPFA